MAGLIVGRLTAQLGLDDTGFASGVRRAGSSMQTLGTQSRDTERAISSAMRGSVSEVDRYAAKVAQARANQAAAAARAEKAERQLQAAQNAGNTQRAADAEIRLAQARARLTTATQTTQEAVAGLQAANAGAAETSDQATESITNMGDSSDTTAGKLAAMAAGAIGAGAAVSKVLTTGMDYTSTMNKMQGVSGSTAGQMGNVSKAARALGSDISLPGTSANDAATAMMELSKGGFSVQQSMDAARGTLQLAAAAQIEAGDAATIQSQALQAFGQNATFASQAADILANTSNASSAEITDVAAALQQAGPVAAGFGVNMADTATMIGLFANAGITGSDAGTLLKTALQSLTDQGAPAQQAIKDLGLTVYDQQGTFVGMRSLWDQLSVASRNMSEEQFQAATNVLFGSDAMRAAMIAAGGGTEAFDKMSTAINKQGTAADLAQKMMQGLPGAWERVQNSLESVALTTYDLVQGPLTSLAHSGADMIGVGDDLAGSLGFLMVPVSALASAFAAIPGPLQTAITLFIAGRIAMSAFGSQIASAQSRMSAAGGVMRNLSRDATVMQRSSAAAGISMNRMSGYIAAVGRNSPMIATMAGAYRSAAGQASNFARVQGTIAASAVGARGAIGGLTGALGGTFGIAIMGAIGLLTMWMSKKRQDAAASAETEAATKSWADALDESKGAITRAVREKAANEAADKKLITGFEKLGVASNQVVDGVLGQGDALATLRQRLDAVIEANTRIETVDGAKSGMQTTKKVYNETAQSAQKLKDDLNKLNGAYEAGKSRAMQVAEATGDLKRSLDGTTQAVGPMTEAMVEFGESTDGSASKVDKLAKALSALQGDKMTEQEALQSWSNGMRDFAKALEEGGSAAVMFNGQVDVTTEKGSALHDSTMEMKSDFDEMAAATYEAALAQGQDLAGALDTTRVKLQQQRQAFVDAAVAGGMSVDTANALADAYGLIPSEVVLNLDTTAIQAGINGLGALGIKASTLPAGKVRVLDNTDETRRKLDDLKIRYAIIDGKLVITDTTPANMKRLNDLGIKTTSLPNGFIKIDDTSPANIERLKQLGVTTTTLPDGSVVINLNDDDARRRMAELTAPGSKTITVYAVDENGVSVTNSPMFGKGLGVLKPPGSYRGGRLPAFAGGGRLPGQGPGTETRDGIYGVTRDGRGVAMLDGREWVINADSSEKYDPLLRQINAGTLPGFADGGTVGPGPAATPAATAAATPTAGAMVTTNIPGLDTAVADVAAGIEGVKRDQLDPAMTEMTGDVSTYGLTTRAQTEAVKTAWSGVGTHLQAQRTGIIDPAVQGLATTVQTQVGLVVKPALAAMSSASTATAQTVQADASGVINPAMQSVGQTVSAVHSGTVDPVLAAMRGAVDNTAASFGAGTAAIGAHMNNVREATAAPVRFTIGTVFNDGLVGMWNSVSDLVGTSKMNPYPIAFASGGVLPGYTPGRDVHMFSSPTGGRLALSGGEAIMRPEWTQAVGGPAAVDEMNAAARSGRVKRTKGTDEYVMRQGATGAMASGGTVANGAEITSQIQQTMWDAVRTAFPNVVLTSGTRYADVGSGFDNHMGQRALDLAGPMPEIARWIYQMNRTQPVEELIHAPLQGWQNLEGGQPFDFGASTDADHYDHVHWAMAQMVDNVGKLVSMAMGGGPAVRKSTSQIMDETMAPLRDSLTAKIAGTQFPGMVGGLPQAVFGKINDAMTAKLKELATQYSGPAVGGGDAVERWRPMVIEALKRNGFEPNQRNQDLMLSQIASESSGNPGVVQGVQDVNSGGNEAQGLLQIVPGTFAAHRDPSLPDDRTDPWANMNAALRYYRATYGDDLSTMWGQGHGYRSGGTIPGHGSGDIVPIWAEPGEEMVRKTMAEKHRPLIKAINRDEVQAFADGGTTGFAGYTGDTEDVMKPKNFYDWAALVAGGGFAVASAVTPYVNMANSGQVSLGDLAPTVDTSANSIDGISQALGASADELKEVLIAILEATRENKKVKATIDSGVMDGLTPALSVAGL